MADQRISQLTPLLRADVDVSADQLPIADVSTAETKKITPAALVEASLGRLSAGSIPGTAIANGSITALQLAPDSVGATQLANGAVDTAAIQGKAITTALIADGAVTALQLAAGGIGAAQLGAGAVGTAAIADGAVTAAKITADSLTAAQIAPNAIGASELADGAVDTAAIVDLAVTTPKLADLAVTTAKVAAGAITADKLAADAVTTAKVADGAITDAKITGPIGLGKLGNQAANVVLAGPATGAAAAPSFRAIVPADLPKASAGSIGAVSAPATGGLVVDATGALSLSATVAAGTGSVVTYDANGRITAGRALASSDLPIATASAVGAVKVGTGLSVDTAGLLAVNLTPANIPGLDANKIVSGVIDPARIADKAITRAMLADYAIAYVQEASPATAGQHVGTLWLQESTGQLRMWNGNSWFPIGFGRLSAENLRYCGTFNAATGLISGVTQFGTQGGFTIGSALPVAKDADTGVYFVCSTPGNGTPVSAGVSYDAGDWILCNGSTGGWARIDTLSGGGGGGGGATHLNDLLDVTINVPVAGQFLMFDATGQWLNTADVDGGVY